MAAMVYYLMVVPSAFATTDVLNQYGPCPNMCSNRGRCGSRYGLCVSFIEANIYLIQFFTANDNFRFLCKKRNALMDILDQIVQKDHVHMDLHGQILHLIMMLRTSQQSAQTEAYVNVQLVYVLVKMDLKESLARESHVPQMVVIRKDDAFRPSFLQQCRIQAR